MLLNLILTGQKWDLISAFIMPFQMGVASIVIGTNYTQNLGNKTNDFIFKNTPLLNDPFLTSVILF